MKEGFYSRKKQRQWGTIAGCCIVVLCLYCLHSMWYATKIDESRLELWRNLSFISSQEVKDLVRNGVSINDIGNDGKTPLILASEYGLESTVQVLIDCGADVNAKDDYGRTALLLAKQSGHLAIVKTLSRHTTH